MFFKKKRIIPRQQKTYKTPFLLGGIGIFGIFMTGIFAVQALGNMDFDFLYSKNTSIQGENTQNSENTEIIEDIQEQDISYILLTGKGGGNHDAPELTDTIILVGINQNKEIITMLSIPRDLYVKYPVSGDSGKINEIYYHGLQRGEEIAMSELMDTVGKITGRDIDYYLNIDFQSFIEVVDLLGGVPVTLEENFVDYNYPDNNYGYKTFILKKGSWTLDGEVALMYARSRYSTSDFDRSARQQYILSALKDKILELGYLKDRKKIIELYNITQEYIDTNIPLTEMITLALNIRSWEETNILNYNLNDSCTFYEAECSVGGFLYTPQRQYFDGKSVLIPNNATYYDLEQYSEIQDFSDIIFENPDVYAQNISIKILNASNITGLAGEKSDILKPYGIISADFENLGNIREKEFENSILYYNKLDQDNIVLNLIKKIYEIDIQETDTPQYSDEQTKIELIFTE